MGVIKINMVDRVLYFKMDCELIIDAAERGDIQSLKKLRGIGWDEQACAFAAYGGQLECLKWLRMNGAPWNEQACVSAAWGGHLECLKWLKSEGAPWNKYTCNHAAVGGHLDCLKWLRSEGDHWNEQACKFAAWGDHLNCLVWMRGGEAGVVPWDDITRDTVVKKWPHVNWNIGVDETKSLN